MQWPPLRRSAPRCLASMLAAGVGALCLSAGWSFALAPVEPPARPAGGLPFDGPRALQFPQALASNGGSQGRAAGVFLGWALAASAVAAVAATAAPRGARRPQRRVQLCALPEAADLAHQAQQWFHAAGGDPAAGFHAGLAELASAAQHAQQWAGDHAAGAKGLSLDLVPPAYAADPAPLVLDPNTKYLYGADGQVLLDPMSNKPLTDDWWNGFIGIQSDIIKETDKVLRAAGVPQAFGWTIVLYTLSVKALFYPLQQSQLRSTSMMQLMSPKVKEIQEKYKDDPEAMQNVLGQLYSTMDVNPLGGCLPTLLQLPIYWSLYGVWRRLSAESFPFFKERWLWVPSLAQPNPDFQFKFDWLFQFQDGKPVMGWEDYTSYLVFPAILIGFTLFQQQQAQVKQKEGEEQQLLLQVLPWVSVYFIGALSLELPQAVSVYYSVNTGLTVAQTAFVKWNLRQEIPGYEEFEKTGKFPEGAFEDAVRASGPVPKTLHEAALRGDRKSLEALLDGGGDATGGGFDINAWDEKQIAPLGYAVACGHLDAVQFLISRGANLQIVDGQDNTLLHYAAGYGHKAVIEELLTSGAEVWPENTWSERRNKKGQTVLDAATVNRKGPVVDFLREKLGLEALALPAPAAAAGEDGAAAPGHASSGAETDGVDTAKATAEARAALLAAARDAAEGKPVDAAAGAAASSPLAAVEAGEPGSLAASPTETAAAMRAAVQKLKSNPEAVEQARKMMAKMPPQLLSMMSGNKLSAEQAQKALESVQEMSTEDILAKANVAAEGLSGKPAEQVPAVSGGGEQAGQARPARAVD